MKKFKTKIDCCGYGKGTIVTFDEVKNERGKTDKMLCSVPNGGALFFNETDLEEVE